MTSHFSPTTIAVPLPAALSPPPSPPLPSPAAPSPPRQPPVQIQVPIGFEFDPTNVELVCHYLRKKLMNEDFPLREVLIHEVNLYLFHPSTLARNYRSASDNQWYFFTPRERKHINGNRPNLKAASGFWKATGCFDKIKHQGQVVGRKRSLIFDEGDSKHGIKTNWIMHEYVYDGFTKDNKKMFHSWVCCIIHYNGKQKSSSSEPNNSYYAPGPSAPLQIGSSHLPLPAPVDTLPPPTSDSLLTQIPQVVAYYSSCCPVTSTTPMKEVYHSDTHTGTTTIDALSDFSRVTGLFETDSGFFDENSDDFLCDLDYLLQ
ncbi:NAC transcription factor 32-like [Aristolochia californica]|uniref:NAC transcription factor 32-like n=1 Tax=Aristolochia californica TaxID=171875 RepID=UPI0035DBD2E2